MIPQNFRLTFLFGTAVILAISMAFSAFAGDIIDRSRNQPAMVQTSVTLDAVADATVRSDRPDTNFGSEDYLEITYTSTDVIGVNRMAAVLIRFDLSSIPDEAVVDSAHLRLYMSNASGANPVTITANFVTSSWSESTVTWNSNPTTSAGINASIDASTGAYKSWYIPTFVQSWINDPSSNRGLLLLGPLSGDYYQRWFESRDYMEMVPQLELSYHLPPYTFSGHVYEGEPEDTSTPLEGVTVELWGDQDELPEAGYERVRLDSTTSSASGAFSLDWSRDPDWPYLHVIEVDPLGSYSTGADVDPPGYVNNDNVISYRPVDLLETGLHDFGGIAFWDRPVGEEQPDLVISDIWLQSEQVCFQVHNVGTGPSPVDHVAQLDVDTTYLSDHIVPVRLEPGQRYDGCFQSTYDCSGQSDLLTVYADYSGDIQESNESNNTRSENFLCDKQPPSIVDGPNVVDITTTTARLVWQTDELSSSGVRYGANSAWFGYELEDSDPVLAHSLTLTGLKPSQTYHYVVFSLDPSGNGIYSTESMFTTAAQADTILPTLTIGQIPELQGQMLIPVQASDNTGIERVEFYLDDVLIYTDYSEPYELPIDSLGYANGDHDLQVRAYDLYGLMKPADRNVHVSNPVDQTLPNVVINTPVGGATLKADQYIDATASDDTGLLAAIFYVDGVAIGSKIFPAEPTYANFGLSWGTTSVPNGKHRIGVMASDLQFKTYTAVVDIVVDNPPQLPKPELVISAHSLTRWNNTFDLDITIQNIGTGEARNVWISDYFYGFQATGFTDKARYTALYAMNDRFGICRIESLEPIAAGSSRTYSCRLATVLHHPNPPTPSVGHKVTISYDGPDGTHYSKDLVSPIAATTGNEAIPVAHANAAKTSDYLIVTNPRRLLLEAPSYSIVANNVFPLMEEMAQLAKNRTGVLGYLDVTDRNTIRNLIIPNGEWAKRLHPNFSQDAKGYLLLVGETEIIPSKMYTGLNITWSNSTCATNEVDLSDLFYANTGGSDGAPELIVGRVIGNNATDLLKSIQTSNRVYANYSGYGFDRSDVLAISGVDSDPSMENQFVDTIDGLESALESEFDVKPLHFYEFTAAKRVTEVTNHDKDKDVLHYNGHGFPDAWDELKTTHVLNTPLDFGNVNPFVSAFACFTGSYEDHIANYNPNNLDCARDGGDYNIAEAFFDRGAGVYIGSTDRAGVNQNEEASMNFFSDFWKPFTTIGEAFTDYKRDRWDKEPKWNLWVIEYNLYGDPKYGARPPNSPLSLVEPSQPASDLAQVEIDVPAFTLTRQDGWDYVDIPGGDVRLEGGEYRIPYYTVNLPYSPGVRIQAVNLLERADPQLSKDLNLPLNVDNSTSHPLVQTAPEEPPSDDWFPGLGAFDWSVRESVDGSSELILNLYAVEYQPATAFMHFYPHYSFEIVTSISPVLVTQLALDQPAYHPGDPVGVTIDINNSDDPQEVVFSADIRRFPSGELVSGLLLRSLSGLSGPASFAPTWDSSGFEPGDYLVEATLLDGEGKILDRRSAVFRLGIYSAEVTGLSVNRQHADPGEPILVQLELANTGDQPLNGQALVRVLAPDGEVAAEYRQIVTNLAPGKSLSFTPTWDTSGFAGGSYAVKGYIFYDGTSAGPATDYVSLITRHLFLPIIQR